VLQVLKATSFLSKNKSLLQKATVEETKIKELLW